MSNDIGNSATERMPWFSSGRIRFLMHILVFALSIVAAVLMAGAAALKAGHSSEQTDFHHLEGRWVRPDGGYILDLRYISGDGKVRAAYFNPRRINVSRAELRLRNDGTIRLFVELRDVNYPVSTYDLFYNPKSDRFVGTCFQAARKLTRDVEFVRVK